jgi:hypothetical protein
MRGPPRAAIDTRQSRLCYIRGAPAALAPKLLGGKEFPTALQANGDQRWAGLQSRGWFAVHGPAVAGRPPAGLDYSNPYRSIR